MDSTEQVKFFSVSWQHYQLLPLFSTHKTCYLTLARLRHIGQPIHEDMCVCVCESAHGSGWFWDIKDLVLYDVWHDMRRHAWNEIVCRPAESFICVFRVNVWSENWIYTTAHFLISFVILVAHDAWPVANSELTALTDRQHAAQCSPCKMTSVSIGYIANIPAHNRL